MFNSSCQLISDIGRNITDVSGNILTAQTVLILPIFLYNFYPRDAMLVRIIAIATCLSVSLSVRPSRAGIASKRRKLASLFLHHLVALRL